jgi:hypothetical protein
MLFKIIIVENSEKKNTQKKSAVYTLLQKERLLKKWHSD